MRRLILFLFIILIAIFFVSTSFAEPTIAAKWYNLGTNSGTYSELTAAGNTGAAWDYEVPYRYLEIDLRGLDTTKQYQVDVMLVTGLQFQGIDAWTTPERSDSIESTTFAPLGDYNGYSNS